MKKLLNGKLVDLSFDEIAQAEIEKLKSENASERLSAEESLADRISILEDAFAELCTVVFEEDE